MKSLQQHISEKLVINKDFKRDFEKIGDVYHFQTCSGTVWQIKQMQEKIINKKYLKLIKKNARQELKHNDNGILMMVIESFPLDMFDNDKLKKPNTYRFMVNSYDWLIKEAFNFDTTIVYYKSEDHLYVEFYSKLDTDEYIDAVQIGT